MKVLQLGKFYPIRGGVEKVMYDLMAGLDERGVACDMLCAATSGRTRTVKVGSRARVFCCRSLRKVAGTMLSPTLVRQTRRICKDYDIIHVHHPDPTACLALLCSGFRGRVVLHWHSDIVKQRRLLKLYEPMQRWLIRRADIIIGTTPVYLAESPFLREVQHKVDCLPIGVSPMHPQPEAVARLQARYPGKKIVFSLGRLVPYKGFKYLVRAARYLDDSYVVLIGGSGPLEAKLRGEIEAYGLEGRVQLLGQVADATCLPTMVPARCFACLRCSVPRPLVSCRSRPCRVPVLSSPPAYREAVWHGSMSMGCRGSMWLPATTANWPTPSLPSRGMKRLTAGSRLAHCRATGSYLQKII